jgi:hypothetical protein
VWKAAIFEGVILPEDIKKYRDNDDVKTVLQTIFTNTNGTQIVTKKRFDESFNEINTLNPNINDHKIDPTQSSGQILEISSAYNSGTYRFEVTPQNQGNQGPNLEGHVFVLFYDIDDNKNIPIWELMGFRKSDIYNKKSLETLFGRLQTGAYNGTTPSTKNKFKPLLFNETNITAKAISATDRMISSVTTPSNENHIKYINIASDALGNDGYMMKNGEAKKVNILATIPNTSQKFSFLHHSNEALSFHDLKKSKITHFDIVILNEDLQEFDEDSIDDFKCLIVFEEVQEIIKTESDVRRAADIGYQMSHPTK